MWTCSSPLNFVFLHDISNSALYTLNETWLPLTEIVKEKIILLLLIEINVCVY